MDNEVAEVLVGHLRLREKIADLQLSESPAPARAKRVNSPQVSKGFTGRSIGSQDMTAELNSSVKPPPTPNTTLTASSASLHAHLSCAYHPRLRLQALKLRAPFLKNSELVERFEFASSNQGGSNNNCGTETIMLYDQYFIDDLKNRADLVRIIQPYKQGLEKEERELDGVLSVSSGKNAVVLGQSVERVLPILRLR